MNGRSIQKNDAIAAAKDRLNAGMYRPVVLGSIHWKMGM